MARMEIGPEGQRPMGRGVEMEQFNTRLPKDMCDSLRAAAREQNRPIRDLVESCLTAGLVLFDLSDRNIASQPGTKAHTGPVPSHLTVIGPCVGHGTGGFVWCVRCSEADSQVPVERCYLVIEACTRPGCTVQYEWPVCPSCLAALTDEIAYLCLNCLYVLKLNRQLVESGKADSTEIGKRI